MSDTTTAHRLDRPVDRSARSRRSVRPSPTITLVEYGSYACPYCRAANEEIAKLRDRFGDRLRYVFRHRPITGSDDRAARCRAGRVPHPIRRAFWDAHVKLMTRSDDVSTEDDLARRRARPRRRRPTKRSTRGAPGASACRRATSRARARAASRVTPTFFINGRRYDGPWDESSLSRGDAGLARPSRALGGARLRELGAVDRRPAAGDVDPRRARSSIRRRRRASTRSGSSPFGFAFGDAGFRMSLRALDRRRPADGLLPASSASRSSASSPSATSPAGARRRCRSPRALGGMIVPALVYLPLIPAGPWRHGWGMPMATDTAFAVALIVMLGERVPVELRVFLTAAAIVDDIGAIVVVALFYSGELHCRLPGCSPSRSPARWRCSTAPASTACCPTRLLGVALWACVHAGGLHATLAGVLLALFIPTRPPPNLQRADAAGRRDHDRRNARAARRCCGTGRRCRRCARSTRSTIGSSRPPTALLRYDRAVVELRGAAALRAGERRRRDVGGSVRGTRAR